MPKFEDPNLGEAQIGRAIPQAFNLELYAEYYNWLIGGSVRTLYPEERAQWKQEPTNFFVTQEGENVLSVRFQNRKLGLTMATQFRVWTGRDAYHPLFADQVGNNWRYRKIRPPPNKKAKRPVEPAPQSEPGELRIHISAETIEQGIRYLTLIVEQDKNRKEHRVSCMNGQTYIKPEGKDRKSYLLFADTTEEKLLLSASEPRRNAEIARSKSSLGEDPLTHSGLIPCAFSLLDGTRCMCNPRPIDQQRALPGAAFCAITTATEALDEGKWNLLVVSCIFTGGMPLIIKALSSKSVVPTVTRYSSDSVSIVYSGR